MERFVCPKVLWASAFWSRHGGRRRVCKRLAVLLVLLVPMQPRPSGNRERERRLGPDDEIEARADEQRAERAPPERVEARALAKLSAVWWKV